MTIPTSTCVSCGTELDAWTGMANNKDVPAPGDITICLRCGHIMAFADNLELRELSAQEAYSVAGNPKILAVQRARQKVLAEED